MIWNYLHLIQETQQIDYVLHNWHNSYIIVITFITITQMISSLKKSVNKAYKASKKAIIKATSNQVDTNSKALILLFELKSSKKQILPTSKMQQIANYSYDMQEFDALIFGLFEILTSNDDFHLTYLYEPDTLKKKMRKVRNYLVVCGYLIKHGASGFIDQFRDRIDIFQHYAAQRSLSANNKICQQMKDRADYIIVLLKNKNRLLKEKELAMLIKQKMQIQQQAKISSQNQSKLANIENGSMEPSQLNKSEIVENFLENYLFKYVYKLDEGLDHVADFVAGQLQKYLVEQIPENFQIEEIQEISQNHMKSEFDLSIKKDIEEQEQQFVKDKNKPKVINQDLLQLEK